MKPSSSRELVQTTPFPNVLLDEVMPRLKDTPWRVLCVVVRQTLGWQSEASGSRKERDWLTRSQLMARTGRNSEALSAAIDTLVRQGYIEVQDSKGQLLSTPQDRRKSRGRIYYGLTEFWRQKIKQTTSPENRKTEQLYPSACSVFSQSSRNSEHVGAGKANGTKETLTKETQTKSQELIQDFITVFEKVALESAVATKLIHGKVSVQLDVPDTHKLEMLLQKNSVSDWTPFLQHFFASDLEYVRSRQYSLSAFVNSHHILSLRYPVPRRNELIRVSETISSILP